MPVSFTLGRINLLLMIVVIAALALTIFMIVPLIPATPVNGLNDSWVYALNEAVARHLVFGRDIIYTYGPLAAIETRMYHPATDAIMVMGSLLVAAGLCAGFAVLAGKNRFLIVLLPVVIAESGSIDALLIALPLLLLLAVAKPALRPRGYDKSKTSKFELSCIILLSCAVAVLPLIKGSFAVIALGEGGLAIMISLIDRRFFLAASIAMAGLLTLILTWIWVGQPLIALPQFFLTQQPVIGGYSEAMSIRGPFSAVLYWAITALLILALFYWRSVRKTGGVGWLAFLGLLVFLFVTFKVGFVRQDAHSLISGAAFLFIMLYLFALLDIKSSLAIGAIALFGWIMIEQSVAPFDMQTAYMRLKLPISSILQGLDLRLNGQKSLQGMFDHAKASIRAESPLPPVTGTADMYPSNLMPLFASGITWSGRPTLQSYAAYTPFLATANADHLSSSNAPDDVFFSIAPIDDRLPALEDAASWPIILTHYVPVGLVDEYIHMARSKEQTEPVRFNSTSHFTVALDEKIDVPSVDGVLRASIDIQPTLLGRLMLSLYRLNNVYIELTLDDGTVVRHRYIPEMGQTGFVLSPYVGSTFDFLRLTSDKQHSKHVISFRLTAPKTRLWNKEFKVSFDEFHSKEKANLRQLLRVESTPIPENLSLNSNFEPAECAIDFIDEILVGAHASPFIVKTGIIPMMGWAAPSATTGIGPEETLVSLTDDSGVKRFYQSKLQPRDDVKIYFHHPEMTDVGFNINLDLSGLTGHQRITIYSLKNGQFYKCPVQPVLLVQ
jgi:hypothetical protein